MCEMTHFIDKYQCSDIFSSANMTAAEQEIRGFFLARVSTSTLEIT